MKKPPYHISFLDFKKLGYEIELNEEFEEQEDEEGVVYKVTSKIDLVSIASPDKQKLSREALKNALYSLGLDTKGSFWEISEKRYHRPFSSNSVKFDHTFQGSERIDPEWISSGNASQAAIVASGDNKDMQRALRSLTCGNKEGW